MTSDASRVKNNHEFRRLMLAGALSMSPELAAACDKLETATIEELDAALAGDAQRSAQLDNEAETLSTIGAPEPTPLMTIAMPAAALTSTADVASLAWGLEETMIGMPESDAESAIQEARIHNDGTPSRASGSMLAKAGLAVSELRRVAVSAESPSKEALPTRFARAMSLIRSQFASPGATVPSG
jgi:hypothetical protein